MPGSLSPFDLDNPVAQVLFFADLSCEIKAPETW